MDHTDAAILISDCEARESRLSDWEAEFIDSIKAQITDGRSLTDRQAATLEEIWDKATEKG